MMEFTFTQVPPPTVAPPLSAEVSRDQWRCSKCFKMQPGGSELTWIPDGVRMGDPDWSISEALRLNAYNGTGSGWCNSCVAKLTRSSRTAYKGVGLASMLAIGQTLGEPTDDDSAAWVGVFVCAALIVAAVCAGVFWT